MKDLVFDVIRARYAHSKLARETRADDLDQYSQACAQLRSPPLADSPLAPPVLQALPLVRILWQIQEAIRVQRHSARHLLRMQLQLAALAGKEVRHGFSITSKISTPSIIHIILYT